MGAVQSAERRDAGRVGRVATAERVWCACEGICAWFGDVRMSGTCADCCVVRGSVVAVPETIGPGLQEAEGLFDQGKDCLP